MTTKTHAHEPRTIPTIVAVGRLFESDGEGSVGDELGMLPATVPIGSVAVVLELVVVTGEAFEVVPCLDRVNLIRRKGRKVFIYRVVDVLEVSCEKLVDACVWLGYHC